MKVLFVVLVLSVIALGGTVAALWLRLRRHIKACHPAERNKEAEPVRH